MLSGGERRHVFVMRFTEGGITTRLQHFIFTVTAQYHTNDISINRRCQRVGALTTCCLAKRWLVEESTPITSVCYCICFLISSLAHKRGGENPPTLVDDFTTFSRQQQSFFFLLLSLELGDSIHVLFFRGGINTIRGKLALFSSSVPFFFNS